MKLKNVLKRVAFYGAFLAFLNYYGLPIGGCIGAKMLKKEAQNKKVQQVCQTDRYLEDIISSIDRQTCEPLQLLKAAHAIASKKLDYQSTLWLGEKEQAFSKGKGDCKYFSLFTYSNFLYLADEIGRPSLKDQVRLVIGFSYDSDKIYCGHAWLQVQIDGKWHDYETTEDPIGKNEKIDFKNLDEKLPDEEVLDQTDCMPCSQVQYENGLLEDRTNFKFSIETGAELRKCWHYFKNEVLGL